MASGESALEIAVLKVVALERIEDSVVFVLLVKGEVEVFAFDVELSPFEPTDKVGVGELSALLGRVEIVDGSCLPL